MAGQITDHRYKISEFQVYKNDLKGDMTAIKVESASAAKTKHGLRPSIKEKILASTRSDAEFYDVTESYKVLGQLNVQVSPQLEEIDYYKGCRISPNLYDRMMSQREIILGYPEDLETEYFSDSDCNVPLFSMLGNVNHLQGEFNVPLRSQYSPISSQVQMNLKIQRKLGFRKLVELREILNNFEKGQICFVGPAGSGKTTLLKAICQDVMDRKYENLKDIEVVHVVKCRDFKANDNVTPAELLFRNVNPKLDNDEMNECLEFANENPHKILFVLDSLDTLPYTLEDKHHVIPSCHGLQEKASPATILLNLFSGKLIPHLRCITSSREHAIRSYMGNLRADRVIALVGLTEKSMEQIITGYVDEPNAGKIMQYLRSNCLLMSLCKTPVFLVFTIIGFQAEDKFTPCTTSGIMILLLQNLLHSPHARVENIEDVINKLKHLSYIGTTEGRVLFDADDLANCGLKEEEVNDVAVLAPGGRRQCLVEGESLLFFCHQSIQETLAAFYIAEMDLDEFETFISQQLHSSKYSVIRRIVCGIVLDEEVKVASQQLLKEDFEDKRSLLLESLKRAWNKQRPENENYYMPTEPSNSDADQLELLVSMFEARDGVKQLISSINEITLKKLPLLLSDIHAVGSVMNHCSHLRLVKLTECNLNSSLLEVLASSIKGSDIKISKLILGVQFVDAPVISFISEIVQQCLVESLEIMQPPFWRHRVITFSREKSELCFLREQLKDSALLSVGRFVSESNVASLQLSDCKLSLCGLSNLIQSTKSAKIAKLDLSKNAFFAVSMSSVGKLANQCQVDSLNLSGCNQSLEGLTYLAKTLQNHPISELKLGVTLADAPECVSCIFNIVEQALVQLLEVYVENFELMAIKFSSERSTLKLSRFPLGQSAMSAVGKFVKEYQIRSLSMFNCKLTSQNIQNFLLSVGDSMISNLQLTRESLDEASMPYICQMVQQCQVESLELSDCKEQFSFAYYKRDNYDNSEEYFSDHVYRCDPGPSVSRNIVSLLPVVRKLLKIDFYMKDEDQKLLQRELNKLSSTELKILGYSSNRSHKWTLISHHLKQGVEKKFQTGILSAVDNGTFDEGSEKTVDTDDEAYNDNNEDISDTGSDFEIEDSTCSVGEDDEIYSTSSSEFDYSIYTEHSQKKVSVEDAYEKVCEVLLSSDENKLTFKNIDFTKKTLSKIRESIDKNKLYQEMKFENCRFMENDLCCWSAIEWQNLKIHKLNLQGSTIHGNENVKILLQVIKEAKVEEMIISSCRFPLVNAEVLKSGLICSSVSKFVYNYNYETQREDIEIVVALIHRHEFEKIEMKECELTPTLLYYFVETSESAKVCEFDLSGNKKIGTIEGMKLVSKLVRLYGVRRLFLRSCNLTEKSLQKLAEKLSTWKLSVDMLDLSDNSEIIERDAVAIAYTIQSLNVKELSLAWLNLDHKKMKSLHSNLRNAELDRLDLQSNPGMSYNAFEMIGNLVNDCKINSLDLSRCQITPRALRSFASAINPGVQLKELNISKPQHLLTSHTATEAMKLFSVVSEKLFLHYKKIGKNNRAKLREALSKRQVQITPVWKINILLRNLWGRMANSFFMLKPLYVFLDNDEDVYTSHPIFRSSFV